MVVILHAHCITTFSHLEEILGDDAEPSAIVRDSLQILVVAQHNFKYFQEEVQRILVQEVDLEYKIRRYYNNISLSSSLLSLSLSLPSLPSLSLSLCLPSPPPPPKNLSLPLSLSLLFFSHV